MQTDCIGAAEYTPAFSRFWSVYPKKVGKQTAFKSWQLNGLEAKADGIIAHVEDRKQTDPQWVAGYAPHPTTFLNQQRWTDEVEAPKAAPKRQTESPKPEHCSTCGLLLPLDGGPCVIVSGKLRAWETAVLANEVEKHGRT